MYTKTPIPSCHCRMYVPCFQFFLNKCKIIFGAYIGQTNHGRASLGASVGSGRPGGTREARPGREHGQAAALQRASEVQVGHQLGKLSPLLCWLLRLILLLLLLVLMMVLLLALFFFSHLLLNVFCRCTVISFISLVQSSTTDALLALPPIPSGGECPNDSCGIVT